MNLQICPDCKKPGERYRNRASRTGLDSLCKNCRKVRVRAHKLANPHLSLANQRAWRIRQHGITVEEFEAMGDTCHICGVTAAEGRRLSIDHDHGHCSGVYGCAECVRGVLCDRCNFLVGFIEAGDDIFERAMSYLGRQ